MIFFSFSSFFILCNQIPRPFPTWYFLHNMTFAIMLDTFDSVGRGMLEFFTIKLGIIMLKAKKGVFIASSLALVYRTEGFLVTKKDSSAWIVTNFPSIK